MPTRFLSHRGLPLHPNTSQNSLQSPPSPPLTQPPTLPLLSVERKNATSLCSSRAVGRQRRRDVLPLLLHIWRVSGVMIRVWRLTESVGVSHCCGPLVCASSSCRPLFLFSPPSLATIEVQSHFFFIHYGSMDCNVSVLLSCRVKVSAVTRARVREGRHGLLACQCKHFA